MSVCPNPNCHNELKQDAMLCSDCYFQVPKHLTTFLRRMRIAAELAKEGDEKKQLQERFEANLRGICRDIKVPEKKRATA